MEYTGYKTIIMDEEQLALFYSNPFLDNLKENEYMVIMDRNQNPIDYYQQKNGKLRRVPFCTIENDSIGTIKPLDYAQYCAIDLLQNREIPVKILRGIYGSGKDMLMANEAYSLVRKGIFDKIIYIRPNVTVGGVPEIGYLKGDLNDKMGWTLAPLYDKFGGEEGVNALVERGQLEMVPLLFIRGRSFENSLIYVTEGQNMTSEVIKLILGRVGEGSELWINGDNHQTDRRLYDDDNGMTRMIQRLSGQELFGYVYLPFNHRSKVAELCELMED